MGLQKRKKEGSRLLVIKEVCSSLLGKVPVSLEILVCSMN
jgi:hypothetical protein